MVEAGSLNRQTTQDIMARLTDLTQVQTHNLPMNQHRNSIEIKPSSQMIDGSLILIQQQLAKKGSQENLQKHFKNKNHYQY